MQVILCQVRIPENFEYFLDGSGVRNIDHYDRKIKISCMENPYHECPTECKDKQIKIYDSNTFGYVEDSSVRVRCESSKHYNQ